MDIEKEVKKVSGSLGGEEGVEVSNMEQVEEKTDTPTAACL